MVKVSVDDGILLLPSQCPLCCVVQGQDAPCLGRLACSIGPPRSVLDVHLVSQGVLPWTLVRRAGVLTQRWQINLFGARLGVGDFIGGGCKARAAQEFVLWVAKLDSCILVRRTCVHHSINTYRAIMSCSLSIQLAQSAPKAPDAELSALSTSRCP
jgi:hypothetical protein